MVTNEAHKYLLEAPHSAVTVLWIWNHWKISDQSHVEDHVRYEAALLKLSTPEHALGDRMLCCWISFLASSRSEMFLSCCLLRFST